MSINYIENQGEFTNEALRTLNSYLEAVYNNLSGSELEEDELLETMEELKSHIIDYCKIKANNEVISTDIVKMGINKLGSPEEISETFTQEVDFFESMRKEDSFHDNIESNTWEITVKDVVWIHRFLSWSLTGLFIFILFSFGLTNLYAILFTTSTFMIFIISQHKSYNTNSYLKQTLKPTIHHLITPLLILINFIDENANDPYSNTISQSSWSIPLIIFMWIVLFSTEPGQKYMMDIKDNILEITENK